MEVTRSFFLAFLAFPKASMYLFPRGTRMWSGSSIRRPCPMGSPSHFVGCVLKLLGIVDEKYFQGLLGEAKDLTNLTAICFPKMEAVEGTIFRCIPKSVSRFTYSSSLSLRQTWRHTVRNPIGPDDLIAASRKSSSMGAERYHTCHCTMI